jgi:hypothetical protein
MWHWSDAEVGMANEVRAGVFQLTSQWVVQVQRMNFRASSCSGLGSYRMAELGITHCATRIECIVDASRCASAVQRRT